MKSFLVVVLVTFILLIPAEPAHPGQWEYSTDLGIGSVKALSVAGSDSVWAALDMNSNGAIWRFDGGAWVHQTDLYPGASGDNWGVYGLDDQHIWVGGQINYGSNGQIYFGDGTDWYLQTEITGVNSWVFDVYAADQNNIWGSGPAGHLYCSFDGGANWFIQTDTGSTYWFSIDGIDSQNVWAAGGDQPAQIAYYNGSSWTIETSFNTQTDGKYLYSVSAASSDQVWAASNDGMVLKRQPTGQWTVSTVLPKEGWNTAEISVRDASTVGLAMDGDANGIYFYDGSAWAKETNIYYPTAFDCSRGPRAWAGDVYGQVYFQDISGSSGYRTDFDGDGTSDIAIFRAGTGLWAIRGVTRLYFGRMWDYPVPADYDGDGTTDPAIFRASTGLWALRGISRVYFGLGLDTPFPADFDGNGTYGPCIFRGFNGLWAARGVTRVYFGSDDDIAVPGFYSGGPAMDIAIFREDTGLWAVRGLTRIYYGTSSDEPKAADYDGDGIWEPGVFRWATGLWAVRGITRRYFGSAADNPVPASYSGGPASEIGIFRDSSGLWAVAGVTRVYFGDVEDRPVTR